MSARTAPATTQIDSLRFAQTGQNLTGEYPVLELDRLQDQLASSDGVVRYRLNGRMLSGRPTLQISVEAELQMVCQRCLQSYAQPVHAESLIPLARNERELSRWEESDDDELVDAQVADPRLDVRTLVEDEILLSLPIMPRHADGECSLAVG